METLLKLEAKYKKLRAWVAMQPCENPIPIDQNSCHCLSCCKRCGECLPCKMIAEIEAK